MQRAVRTIFFRYLTHGNIKKLLEAVKERSYLLCFNRIPIINLCYYNCYNACNYWELFQWSDALNLGWATLNTIAKIIENSEALSAYAAIIRTSVQMLIKDADYFNTMHIVSPKCLTGEPAGLWDLKFNG